MPLMNHFQPPLHPRRHWEAFHAAWAGSLADDLNQRLPKPYFTEEYTHAGTWLEIDVATYQEELSGPSRGSDNGGGTATLAAPVWAPPTPALTMPAIFPETFEVRVFNTEAGVTLVGAIELISPGNKDRPETRRAFATKCASYLHQGVSLIIIDIVTSRRANLHDEIIRLMEADARFALGSAVELYAVAYRPVLRNQEAQIDIWSANLTVDGALPVLPLRLTGDQFIAVDFEATYMDACRRRRLL